MTRKITYTDKKLEMGERMVDFLPSPSALAAQPETVKVTLELTRDSVEFFKRQARKHRIPYQRMLRRLVDEYARHTPE